MKIDISSTVLEKSVDLAKGLEGLKRQWGVHAAGVILSREPLLDVIPIHRREADGAIITQFDMGACESTGLLKMDFLGLRNLTIIDDALDNIESNRGVRLVLAGKSDHIGVVTVDQGGRGQGGV